MKIQGNVLKWVLKDGVVKRGNKVIIEQAINLTFNKTLQEVEKIIDGVFKEFYLTDKCYDNDKDFLDDLQKELKQKLKGEEE